MSRAVAPSSRARTECVHAARDHPTLPAPHDPRLVADRELHGPFQADARPARADGYERHHTPGANRTKESMRCWPHVTWSWTPGASAFPGSCLRIDEVLRHDSPLLEGDWAIGRLGDWEIPDVTGNVPTVERQVAQLPNCPVAHCPIAVFRSRRPQNGGRFPAAVEGHRRRVAVAGLSRLCAFTSASMRFRAVDLGQVQRVLDPDDPGLLRRGQADHAAARSRMASRSVSKAIGHLGRLGARPR